MFHPQLQEDFRNTYGANAYGNAYGANPYGSAYGALPEAGP